MSDNNQEQNNKQTSNDVKSKANSPESTEQNAAADNAAQNSNKDDDPNPVYTNSDAPQQQIERDSRGAMAKGTKDDASAIYNTDNSTLQSKEEKQHDESVDLNKNDKLDIPDLPETEIDRSISSERGQNEEKNP